MKPSEIIEAMGRKLCPHCDGSGYKCARCGLPSKGWVKKLKKCSIGFVHTYGKCSNCGGSGLVVEEMA